MNDVENSTSADNADQEDSAAEAPAEEVAPAEGGAAPEPTGETDLETQLAEAREQADRHWEDLLRVRAEMDNLRKRSAREMDKARKFGVERLASDLLQVYDSLERGLEAGDAEGATVEKMREGTDLTLKLLLKVLGDHGVEQEDPTGAAFDPERHEAISAVPSPDVPENHVMTCVQKGYLLNDRLIRPAMVIVSKGAEDAG